MPVCPPVRLSWLAVQEGKIVAAVSGEIFVRGVDSLPADSIVNLQTKNLQFIGLSFQFCFTQQVEMTF